MRNFTENNFIRKLIISVICVVMMNFCFAPISRAADFGGKMMGYVRDFLTGLTDSAASLIQLGVTGKWSTATAGKGSGKPEGNAPKSDYWIGEENFEYPILQISPELIFTNKIQLLDINFISEIKEGSEADDKYILKVSDTSPLKELRNIVAGWYVTLRTIAVVGLLSVLIYVGIRIIISSTSGDKAKYKEKLMDWVVAFCLLFFMHYIMAATVTIVDKVNDLLGNTVDVQEGLVIDPDYGAIKSYVGADGELGTGEIDLGTLHYSGIDQDRAIELAKEKGKALGGKFQIEDSEFKEIEKDDQNGIYRSEYRIVYDKFNIVITRTDTWNPQNENEAGKTAFTYEIFSKGNNADDDEENPTVGNNTINTDKFLDVEVSQDSNRVYYFTNYARLFLNVKDNSEYISMATAYLIIYIALVSFTVVFTFRYIKRVIYIAFLTLIAPLVALTYPIDKLKDRKSTGLEYVV